MTPETSATPGDAARDPEDPPDDVVTARLHVLERPVCAPAETGRFLHVWLQSVRCCCFCCCVCCCHCRSEAFEPGFFGSAGGVGPTWNCLSERSLVSVTTLANRFARAESGRCERRWISCFHLARSDSASDGTSDAVCGQLHVSPSEPSLESELGDSADNQAVAQTGTKNRCKRA